MNREWMGSFKFRKNWLDWNVFSLTFSGKLGMEVISLEKPVKRR